MNLEGKLHLIQQIHRQQEANEKYVCSSLKQKYYEKDYKFQDVYNWENSYFEDHKKDNWFASFRLRILVSVILFLCFLIMDQKDLGYGDITSANIAKYIEEATDVEEFMAGIGDIINN